MRRTDLVLVSGRMCGGLDERFMAQQAASNQAMLARQDAHVQAVVAAHEAGIATFKPDPDASRQDRAP